MPAAKLSVNRKALKIVEKLCNRADECGVQIKENVTGATIIDAGIEAKGGYQAGKLITEICLGGYGKAKICPVQYGDLRLPSVFVYTNYPALSTLGSQFADWQIKQGGFAAIGSGPARALARKNRELYKRIGYADEANATVLVLETSIEPPETVIKAIAKDCSVSVSKLSLILVPTASVAGSTQVSGRIAETGLHKLFKVGLDPTKVAHAHGCAPIAPVHPKFAAAMGRANDAILYAGSAHYDVVGYRDDELEQIVEKAPASASKSYGQPFQQIFKSVNYDFYKIDPNLFAPGVVSMVNLDTGSFFNAGEVNIEVLKRSFGIAQ